MWFILSEKHLEEKRQMLEWSGVERSIVKWNGNPNLRYSENLLFYFRGRRQSIEPR